MPTPWNRWASNSAMAVLFGLICAALLAACDGESDEPEQKAEPNVDELDAALVESIATYTGEVEDSDFFVAIAQKEGGEVLAYACDGEETGVWFSGALSDGTVALTSDGGATIEAQITENGATGTLTVSGESYAFTAASTPESYGFARAETEEDGEQAVTGWIALPDGRQKGVRTIALQRSSTQALALHGPSLGFCIPIFCPAPSCARWCECLDPCPTPDPDDVRFSRAIFLRSVGPVSSGSCR